MGEYSPGTILYRDRWDNPKSKLILLNYMAFVKQIPKRRKAFFCWQIKKHGRSVLFVKITFYQSDSGKAETISILETSILSPLLIPYTLTRSPYPHNDGGCGLLQAADS